MYKQIKNLEEMIGKRMTAVQDSGTRAIFLVFEGEQFVHLNADMEDHDQGEVCLDWCEPVDILDHQCSLLEAGIITAQEIAEAREQQRQRWADADRAHRERLHHQLGGPNDIQPR